ncbi:MAG: hypothetical protein KAS93_07530 [Gammaproteobacteria bacterium]|nr:hypothetical protein [Gammaproteobacteria bacterium]
MLKKILSLAVVAILMAPAAFANGGFWPTGSTFHTGAYFGIQGSYVYTINRMKYNGTANPALTKNNHEHGGAGGAFLGYGYMFDTGNLQYLGGEIGMNYRSNYNSSSRGLYGASINANWSAHADLMPGIFFDDAKTTLVYGRLGIEGDQFRIKGVSSSKKVYRPVLRAGFGAEHQLNGNFFVRADYVISVPTAYAKFSIAGDGTYKSRPWYNTVSVGISYRF